VVYVVIQLGLLAALLVTYRFAPGPLLFAPRGAPAAAGLVLVAIAALLALLAFPVLGRALHVTPAPRPGARLKTHGVYRVLRHPMYTAATALAAGLFLLRGGLYVGLAAAAVIAYLLVKARHEEALLAARYPEYEAYRRRTAGVIPLPRRAAAADRAASPRSPAR
jgi:protein-S-isoprenylcysteine O-methyltransferase Ste14